MIKLKTKRALLLMLMSVMTVINARSETTADIDGLRYSLNGAYATVSRVLSSNRSEKIIVPATITYQGLQYTVNHIGNKAFSSAYASYTKEVELPETIEGISEYAFNNSNITKVKLNEGLKELGAHAFENSSITELIIPSTVKTFNTYNSVPYTFSGCNLLRTLIYLGTTAPKFWTATSFTYVPTMGSYSSPSHSINNASVIEMISFSESVFTYSGNAPSPTWTNNVEGYSAELEMPTLHSEVGSYEVTIPVTFTKGEVSFTIGSRFIDKKSSGFKSTFFRRFGIKIISFITKIFAGRAIYDTTSGYRAANRDIIEFFAKDYPTEYPEPITNVELISMNYKIKEVSVEMKDREKGQSSIKAWKKVYYMINVIISIIMISMKGDK